MLVNSREGWPSWVGDSETIKDKLDKTYTATLEQFENSVHYLISIFQ